MLNFITGDPNVEDDFGHIAVDSAGNLYIVDKGNHRIRKLATNGVITTIAGTGTAWIQWGRHPGYRRAQQLVIIVGGHESNRPVITIK